MEDELKDIILQDVDAKMENISEQHNDWLVALYESLNEQLQIKPLLNTEESEN